MKRLAAPTTAFTLLILLALSNGCGVSDSMDKMNKSTERMASQIEQDQEYIKLLSESLAKLEKMGTAMFSMVSEKLFVNTPPTRSDDIDDVLKGPKEPSKPTPPVSADDIGKTTT